MSYCTGRLPGYVPSALRDLEVYATGPLPTPPHTIEVPSVQYPIDCNDRLGDCTYAGIDHLDRAWNADASEHDKLPTEHQIEAAYFVETGGQDTGCVEADVLKRWYSKGIFGEKLAGYAPVDPRSLIELHQSVAFFGGAYLGILCGQPQQEQFERGEEWVYTGQEEEDGHCVVALGYGPNGGLHCATWGGIAVLSAGFLAHKLEEAWVALPHQFVEKKGDQLGLSLATLQNDLSRV